MAGYFLGVHAQRLGLSTPSLSLAAQHLLERYSWPGNTRELESVIHFALLVSGEVIEPEHLELTPSN
ncbi:Nitric oxide reductase transcription regulator NorR1 [compost metagenome]